MPRRQRVTPDPNLHHSESLPDALGESEAFLSFQERLARVAPVNRSVLLVGERGTGKELAAARLHYLSPRWEGPLVALNCAALSPSLLESELFGHEAGSFTGAARRRHGRFEAASGGTLFLDEIGLIPMEVQEKIMRVVEYGHFERVGGDESIRVDVRIIGATNADLSSLADAGKFKSDLLDRLSFEVLFLPPLRERGEDIMLLAHHFAARMGQELRLEETPEFSNEAIDELMHFKWPGNIRELKNVVERAVYQCQGDTIESVNFKPFESPYARLPDKMPEKEEVTEDTAINEGKSLTEAVRELEFNALKNALESCRYHQGEAAEHLGLTYHQFRGLYRKYKDALPDSSNN